MRKFACLFALLLLASWPAAAQDTPKVEVSAHYSYARVNPNTSGVDSFSLNGGGGSLAYNANNWLGIVGEFNGYKVGKIGGVDPDATVFTYLFGPRVSFRGNERITPFVHALFGGARASTDFAGGTSSDNAFSMAFGGGIDAKVSEHVAIRLGQIDYLVTRFDEGTGRVNQNNFRYSGGIVFRFGK